MTGGLAKPCAFAASESPRVIPRRRAGGARLHAQAGPDGRLVGGGGLRGTVRVNGRQHDSDGTKPPRWTAAGWPAGAACGGTEAEGARRRRRRARAERGGRRFFSLWFGLAILCFDHVLTKSGRIAFFSDLTARRPI